MKIKPEDKTEFLSTFFGPLSLPAFAALLILALFTTTIMLQRSALKRDPASPRTPFQFSLQFFVCDTARRIFVAVGLVFLGIRFIPQELPEGFRPLAALIIGWLGDRIGKAIDIISDGGFAALVEKFKIKKV